MNEIITDEPALPEVLEVLLRGNLARKTLRAAIASELQKASVLPGTCDSCGYLSDKSEVDRCDLHGRGTLPKNYCSWWKKRE